MRRTSLSLILALAMVAGACGSDDDRPVDPARLSLQIVSGDRQPARVADAPTVSGAALVPGLSLQQLPDNLLPQPLVARILVDGQPLKSLSAPADPLSPSFAMLPSDVVVTYRVIQPTGVGQRHCGDSFLSSAKPDANGEVTTYWERGTYAGECRMEVRLVVDGQPRVDTAFVVEFEPGALDSWQGLNNAEFDLPLNIGDTLDLRTLMERAWDAHYNEIPSANVTALPDSLVIWTWSELGNAPTEVQQGTGWTTEVPDGVTLGFWRRTRIEYYAPRRSVWCWELDARLRLAISGASNNAGDSWTFPVAVPADAVSPDTDPLCRDLPPN